MLSLLQNEQKGGGGRDVSHQANMVRHNLSHKTCSKSSRLVASLKDSKSWGGGGITPDVALGRPRRPVPRCAGLEKIKYMNYLKVATPDTAPCLSFSKRPLQRIAWCDFLPFTHSWVNNKIRIPKIQEG